MKTQRLLAFLLATLMLLLSVAACGKGKGNENYPDRKDPLYNGEEYEGEDDSNEQTVVGTYTIVDFVSSSFKEGLLAFEGCFEEVNETGYTEYTYKFGYLNTKGEVVIQPQYSETAPFFSGIARVMLDGKYGYIDTTGKIVIPCIYDEAELGFNTLAKVVTKNGETSTTQLININGEAVYTSTENEIKISEFSNGFFGVETEEVLLSGNETTVTYYNEKGEKIFDFKNATNAGSLSDFDANGYAFITVPDEEGGKVTSTSYYAYSAKHVLIDTSGEIADWILEGIDDHYDSVTPIKGGYFKFTAGLDRGDVQYYYVNIEKKTKKRAETYYADALGNNYFYTDNGWEYGDEYDDVILYDDAVVLDPTKIQAFEGAYIEGIDYQAINGKDCFWVLLRNSSGVYFSSLIDVDGNVILAPSNKYKPFYWVQNSYWDGYFSSFDCISGLCVAEDPQTGLFGYIDMEGNWVIQPTYTTASDFSEGNDAAAMVNGTTIIDKTGKVILTVSQAS